MRLCDLLRLPTLSSTRREAEEPGVAPRQAASRGRVSTSACGARPWQDSQARTEESLLPLLLFPFHGRGTLGVSVLEHGVSCHGLPALWSRCPGRAGTQDSRPPSRAWLTVSAALLPRKRRELSPAAGPGDFSSIEGTVSTQGPGRESFPVTGEINSPNAAGGQAANSHLHFIVTNQRCCQNALVWFGKVNCSHYTGAQKGILNLRSNTLPRLGSALQG